MRKLTEEEAKNTRCPFKTTTESRETYFEPCDGKRCMAWTKTDNRIEREDHSGGREMMYKSAFDRGQELKREGPPGSLGVWVLEELGTCVRLFPTAGV